MAAAPAPRGNRKDSDFVAADAAAAGDADEDESPARPLSAEITDVFADAGPMMAVAAEESRGSASIQRIMSTACPADDGAQQRRRRAGAIIAPFFRCARSRALLKF
jgi:hypothetical protein